MRSIRRRLTRELLGAAMLLLGVAWLAFFFIARDELIEQFDDALRAKALAVAALAQPGRGQWQLAGSGGLSRDFGAAHPRDFFEVWAADGSPVLRSASLRGGDLAPPPSAGRVAWNLTLPTGRYGRGLALPFQSGRDGARARLAVASDRGGLDEALGELLWSAAIGGVLLLGAIGLGVPRILGRGLRPLDRLGEEVARIGPDSLSARLPSDAVPDELRPIILRLNALLSRLEQSFERERRFSADLAHELRTPIAELRSAAECAIKWPEARELSADRETLAIARQMEGIVDRMIALARGEQGQIEVRSADLPLDSLAREAWRPFADRAAVRNLRVRLELPPARVRADENLLRSVLHNLYDNAVDYTPAGGEVQVSIDGAPGPPRLTIGNTVDGLEPADVGQIFDRFWRKEAARSARSHLGLGLSLSRVFAQAMGWTLSADLQEGGRRIVFVLAAASR